MLTSQDLNKIQQIIKEEVNGVRSELNILEFKLDKKLDSLESRLTKKIDERADQIIEYVNDNMEAHEKWLQDHDVRIKKLEDNGYQVNDREN